MNEKASVCELLSPIDWSSAAATRRETYFAMKSELYRKLPRALQVHVYTWFKGMQWFESAKRSAMELDHSDLRSEFNEACWRNANIVEMLLKVRQDGALLEFASKEEILDDFKAMKRMVSVHGLSLRFASDRLKANKSLVLEAVRFCGDALQFASDDLKTDREVVREAILEFGPAIRFADESLRMEKEMALTAVRDAKSQELDCFILPFVDNTDREIVLGAVERCGLDLRYAPEYFRVDKEICLSAVANQGLALWFVSEKLRNDYEVVLTALKQNPLAIEAVGEALAGDPFVLMLSQHSRGSNSSLRMRRLQR